MNIPLAVTLLFVILCFSLLTIAHWMRRQERHMSALDDQIAALTADVAAVKADHDSLSAKVEAEAAQVASLKAELDAAHAAGEPVSAEQLAKLAAVHAGLQAAIAPPTEPAPTPEPPPAA